MPRGWIFGGNSEERDFHSLQKKRLVLIESHIYSTCTQSRVTQIFEGDVDACTRAKY
jgi:hypothetical protein